MSNDTYDIHWYTNERPGWYEFRIDREQEFSYDWMNHYESIVLWIQSNVEMPERHARWIIHPEHATFKFRYERDYLRFVLRWS